jgi:hypothetical protein
MVDHALFMQVFTPMRCYYPYSETASLSSTPSPINHTRLTLKQKQPTVTVVSMLPGTGYFVKNKENLKVSFWEIVSNIVSYSGGSIRMKTG